MMKKNLFSLAAIAFLFCGCINSPIAFRSVLHFSQQNASTEGHLTSNPTNGPSQVEAPKSTSDSFKPTTSANTNVSN